MVKTVKSLSLKLHLLGQTKVLTINNHTAAFAVAELILDALIFQGIAFKKEKVSWR
jgi:hypothetical protein